MNHKNIAFYGLLLLTVQNCFTIDYRTIGKRTFKTIVGIPLVSAVMADVQRSPVPSKRNVAYHEAAHALITTLNDIGYTLEGANLHYITTPYFKIFVGGTNTVKTTLADTHILTDEQRYNLIKVAVAGTAQDTKNIDRLAQQKIIQTELHLPITTNLPTDNNSKFNYFLEEASYIMDRPLAYLHADKLASSNLNLDTNNNDTLQLEKRSLEIIHKALNETIPLVDKNQPAIQRVAEALLEKESLTGDEIKELINQTK